MTVMATIIEFHVSFHQVGTNDTNQTLDEINVSRPSIRPQAVVCLFNKFLKENIRKYMS